jgi:hypothetical protein
MARSRLPPLPEVFPMHAHSDSANTTLDCQDFKAPCATGSGHPNHAVTPSRLIDDSNPCGFFAPALTPSSPPLLPKRAPFDVNQGLLPLQTALNGDPAMNDFQRLLPLQTAINGNPAMSDFQTANSVIGGPGHQEPPALPRHKAVLL